MISPGRELDALVAEKVMGISDFKHAQLDANNMCPRCYRPSGANDFLPVQCVPAPYSEDIAAAWTVMERMPPRTYLRKDDDRWLCKIADIAGASAETASLAICLAALKAVGVTV